MSNVKEKMTEVIQSQPEDATYEEIMRELAFERMVARGLEVRDTGESCPTTKCSDGFARGRNSLDRRSRAVAA